MPRYYFDTADGDVTIIDAEGTVLRDDIVARYEALSALPDMAREKMPDGDQRRFVVSVRDEAGQVVYSASLTLSGQWRNNRLKVAGQN